MRSLVLIGAIALFIGTALVPPGGTSVGATIIDGVSTVDVSQMKSFFSGNPVSPVQLIRAGVVLDNAARMPTVQTAVRTVGGTQAAETVSALSAIAAGDKEVTPLEAVTAVASTGKKFAAALMPMEGTTDALSSAIADADPAGKRVLEKISWARDKNDVRLCPDALVAIDSSTGLKNGDVLALCLALVNREHGRCAQVESIELSELCESALAS